MASIGTHEMPENGSARTVRDREAMTLSARDREVFVAALLNPPTPGPRLRKAARASGLSVAEFCANY